MALTDSIFGFRAWLQRKYFGPHPKKAKRLGKRLVDAAAEIGVLLVVFGPLDLVLKTVPEVSKQPTVSAVPSFSWVSGWTIMAVGVVLIMIAAVIEWRLPDDD